MERSIGMCHRYMYHNCPNCKKGIIEPTIILETAQERIVPTIFSPYRDQQGIIIGVCSRCGEIKMEGSTKFREEWDKWAKHHLLINQ